VRKCKRVWLGHVLRHESLMHDNRGKNKGEATRGRKECTCWATWWKYVALKRTAEDR